MTEFMKGKPERRPMIIRAARLIVRTRETGESEADVPQVQEALAWLTDEEKIEAQELSMQDPRQLQAELLGSLRQRIDKSKGEQ